MIWDQDASYILPWVRQHPIKTTLVVGGGILVYYLISNNRRRGVKTLERPADAIRVGRVSDIALYPMKSCKQMVKTDTLYCDGMGCRTNDRHKVRDRSWMLVLESGSMITQRGEPSMVLIQPSFTADGKYLQLDAPNMPTLKVTTDLTPQTSPVLDVNVWGLHGDAVHCGKEASDWFCKYLGKPGHILVCHPPSMEGRVTNTGPLQYHLMFPADTKVAFADIAPVLLLSKSSIDDINKKVDELEVTEKHFRPNIIVEGPDEPYKEDEWDKVYVGRTLVLENTMLAPRCLATTVEPKTGIKNKNGQPLETLKGYRPQDPLFHTEPCLGIFLSVLQEGEFNVGDTVYATMKKK